MGHQNAKTYIFWNLTQNWVSQKKFWQHDTLGENLRGWGGGGIPKESLPNSGNYTLNWCHIINIKVLSIIMTIILQEMCWEFWNLNFLPFLHIFFVIFMQLFESYMVRNSLIML